MKKFILLILKITTVIVIVSVVLDYAYTMVYEQSKNRGKIDYIYNSQGRKFDIVILGSSRANNHFVSEMFEEKGMKTFNFGMSGGHLFEADLLLKLMMERKYTIKYVILEADLNLSNEHRAEGIASKFLPYLHSSVVIKRHFVKEEDFNYLYYVPFYRYIEFDSQIGFREMFLNAIHKKTNHLDYRGYKALKNDKKGNMKNNLSNLKPLSENKYFEEIKQICKINNINFIPIMTPMCESTKGIDYFEKVKRAYPEIHNYENTVTEDRYFSSCGHMNDAGARLFTARIINDFFDK